MYISRITIEGFRNFALSQIDFNDGINVIIGHNNAGKTNLLRAIALIFDQSGNTKRLEVDDFYKNISLESLKKEAPKVRITGLINESKDEASYADDLVVVSNWITKLNAPYEAQLTYEFFLPIKEASTYLQAVKDAENVDQVWKILKKDFIRKFTYKIFGGDPKLQNQAEAENLQKFDFQFLNAIRDVERDMFTGRNTLLREVLQFFIDYELKKDVTKTVSERIDAIRQREGEFEEKVKPAIDDILLRISKGKEEILDYATKTGAAFNAAKPGFEGSITEIEMLSALRLIIEMGGIKVPATHNGLGYNNLIFMSLLLAKMQANTDGNYYGSNAKVYPILVIEEPEAHLHPSMQYKFLKFLKENKKSKVRQVFVTSHSTHITSAVSLDEIICMHLEDSKIEIGYPGRVFDNTQEGKASKAYVERFLDATKSNMLFAQKVILVEGLAEQILIPCVANHINSEKNLTDQHIEVISIGGRYFHHFLKLFDSTKPFSIRKKIACVTDRDPERKLKGSDKFKTCYPFEVGVDPDNFEYKNHAEQFVSTYLSHPNIRFFTQDSRTGKTLEYELALSNPALDFLITDSVSNREELQELMKDYSNGIELEKFRIRTSDENERIKTALASPLCTWVVDDKRRALIASRYLNSVVKGVNALELAYQITKDKESGSPKFTIPSYLKDCISWLT